MNIPSDFSFLWDLFTMPERGYHHYELVVNDEGQQKIEWSYKDVKSRWEKCFFCRDLVGSQPHSAEPLAPSLCCKICHGDEVIRLRLWESKGNDLRHILGVNRHTYTGRKMSAINKIREVRE